MNKYFKEYKIVQIIYDNDNDRIFYVERGKQNYKDLFKPKINEFFSINVNGKHIVTQVFKYEDDKIFITQY